MPVLGALLALSKSQFLYHSLGRGSLSVTAYSVPGVSQRSACGGKVFRGHQPSQDILPVCNNPGRVPFYVNDSTQPLRCDELQLCLRAPSMYQKHARS